MRETTENCPVKPPWVTGDECQRCHVTRLGTSLTHWELTNQNVCYICQRKLGLELVDQARDYYPPGRRRLRRKNSSGIRQSKRSP